MDQKTNDCAPMKHREWECDECFGSTSPGCVLHATDEGTRINKPVLCPYDLENKAQWRPKGTPPGRFH
jgi:hypothetical protein